MSLQSATINCDNGKCYPHYYLCNYRPRRTGSDPLSESLIRFKNLEAEDVEAWVDCSVQEIVKLPFVNNTIVIRSLNSHEVSATLAQNQSLDILGEKLASRLCARWLPFLLHKNRPTAPLKMVNKKERLGEVKDVYQLIDLDEDVSRVIIIDDIVTTGATICSIIGSLSTQFQAVSFIAFSLAKADYGEYLNQSLMLKRMEYQWSKENWVLTEEEKGQKEQLKSWILQDAFPQE